MYGATVTEEGEILMIVTEEGKILVLYCVTRDQIRAVNGLKTISEINGELANV